MTGPGGRSDGMTGPGGRSDGMTGPGGRSDGQRSVPERPRLRSAVEMSVRSRLGPHVAVEAIATSPSAYSSSFRIELVTVDLEDGRQARLVLKDLSWDTMLVGARALRARDTHDSRREIDVYRRVLPFVPPGPPRHLGDFHDPETGHDWLFLEEMHGSQLCHVGEPEAWEAAAAWTGAFHRAGSRPEVLATAGAVGLRRRAEPEYRHAGILARTAVDLQGDDSRSRQLTAVLDRHPEVVASLLDAAPTVIHGQLYPTNVVVDRRGPDWRTCVLDWETAAVGSGATDVAALVEGEWDAGARRRLLAAYAAGHGDVGPIDDLEHEVICARIQLCLELLSLPVAFDPPPERARDWLAIAVGLAGELG